VDYNKVIAENLRAYRKKLELTQEALAGKVDLHSNYIARVERCDERLSLDGLIRIAKALKIPPHLLLVPESYREDPK
jgi:transcriptional regulator with XRE-family HTH domain